MFKEFLFFKFELLRKYKSLKFGFIWLSLCKQIKTEIFERIIPLVGRVWV